MVLGTVASFPIRGKGGGFPHQGHHTPCLAQVSRSRTSNLRRGMGSSLCKPSSVTSGFRPTNQPTNPSSQNNAEDVLLDVCGDYFAALKAYRQMQALLGPKATQAARRLSSSSTKSLGAAARLALYDENVGMLDGVSREQLAELVSLRRRLLHELPRIRTQVNDVMDGYALGNARRPAATHFRKADTANGNSLVKLEVVPNSVKQWVRSKEYSMRKARSDTAMPSSSSQSASSSTGSTATMIPGLQQHHQQQQRLNPLLGQAPIPPSVSAAIPQPRRAQPPTDTLRDSTLEAEASPQQQQQQQGQQDLPSNLASGTQEGTLASQGSGRTGTHAQSADHDDGSGNYLELNATSSRLRAAALAAARYKQTQGKGGGMSKASVTSQQPREVQPAAVPGAVQTGNRQAVYSAPRRSRADAEEASFIVCP